jgi:hypothetical protein
VFDLVQGLLDPLPALALRLAILGDASAAQADLANPPAILPLEDAAFVVASSTHFSSFL